VRADTPIARQTGRGAPPGLPPLRRRPKELDAEPTLFEASAGGTGGLVLSAAGQRRDRRGAGPGSGAPATTDEPGQLLDTAPGGSEPDLETVRRARQIAAAGRSAPAP
jgi:hypothetical protein